jgi:hypothetical protein
MSCECVCSAKRWKSLLPGLSGAAVGGLLGYFAFFWAARHGFYALVLPGGLLGCGAGLLVKDRSMLRATICGLAAAGLGLFTEWRFSPFIKDESLGYFLTHAHQLQPMTLVMIAAGAACGAWMALGRERPAPPAAPAA